MKLSQEESGSVGDRNGIKEERNVSITHPLSSQDGRTDIN